MICLWCGRAGLQQTTWSRSCLSAAGSEIYKLNYRIQTDKVAVQENFFQVIGWKVLGCGVATTSSRIRDTELGQNLLKVLGENDKLLEG